MISITYNIKFLKQMKKLDVRLMQEVMEKIQDFQDEKNHARLKVHSLKGNLKPYHSLRVNYSVRIIFLWITDSKIVVTHVGEHDIYQNLQ
jgi:mRNA-degrading endonuclease YafQ of YafQ-DinJ toxin-antitoxin module